MATKPETPMIAVAVKTFGNNKSHEGLRVKAGTRFAIDTPQGSLRVIKRSRFNQLKAAGLMRGLGEVDIAAAPGAALRRHVTYAEQHTAAPAEVEEAAGAAKPGAKAKAPAARPSVRGAARRKAQEKEPPAPEPMNPQARTAARDGSQTGGGLPPSSSPAVPPLTSSTFKRRGERRG